MKKSKTTLFRTLILALVLVVMLFVFVVAWFTGVQRASADGVNVVSVSGMGLDCSFENGNFQPSISRTVTENFKFPLITGNGSNFFIPALDRTSGSPLTDPSGVWYSKRDAKPAYYSQTSAGYTVGDYYVEDIWFQSDLPLDIYLTDQSAITPLDAGKDVDSMERKSQYGAFSKDNIAGAARIAFYQFQDVDQDENKVGTISGNAVEKNNSEYIWVPNDKYQLSSSENLTPISQTSGSTGGSGVVFNPDGNPPEKWWTDALESGVDGSTYTLSDHYLYYYDYQDTKSMKAVQMYLSNGKYVGVIDVEDTTIDYMISVFDFSMTSPSYPSSLSNFSHKTDPKQWIPYTPDNLYVYGSNGEKLIQYQLNDSINNRVDPYNDNLDWAKLYLTPSLAPNDYGHWQLRVSYGVEDKVLKVDDIVYYKDKYTYITTPTVGSIIGGDNQEKYAITDGSTVVIANNTSSTAQTTFGLNAVATSTNAVRLPMKSVTSAGNTYITPQNPLPSQLFTAQKTGSTYTFSSISTGKYLAIDSGKVVLSNTPTSFSLEGSKTTGPMLKSTDGYYITFSNGQFGASVTTEYAGLQIYEGSEFAFRTDGAAEPSYTYYLSGSTALSNLSKATTSSTGYLLTSDLNTKPVVSLEKQSDNKYKGHIRVKIWVEGTDREAKIPLAGGSFSVHLAFQGKEKTADTQ